MAGDWPLSAAATQLLRDPGTKDRVLAELTLKELLLRYVWRVVERDAPPDFPLDLVRDEHDVPAQWQEDSYRREDALVAALGRAPKEGLDEAVLRAGVNPLYDGATEGGAGLGELDFDLGLLPTSSGRDENAAAALRYGSGA